MSLLACLLVGFCIGVVLFFAYTIIVEASTGYFPDTMAGFVVILILSIWGTIYLFKAPPTPEELRVKAVEQQQEAEARRKRQTPRLIREADGCKVYTFQDSRGYDHYFTRCATETTHDAPRTERVGKVTRTVYDSIKTENK